MSDLNNHEYIYKYIYEFLKGNVKVIFIFKFTFDVIEKLFLECQCENDHDP